MTFKNFNDPRFDPISLNESGSFLLNMSFKRPKFSVRPERLEFLIENLDKAPQNILIRLLEISFTYIPDNDYAFIELNSIKSFKITANRFTFTLYNNRIIEFEVKEEDINGLKILIGKEKLINEDISYSKSNIKYNLYINQIPDSNEIDFKIKYDEKAENNQNKSKLEILSKTKLNKVFHNFFNFESKDTYSLIYSNIARLKTNNLKGKQGQNFINITLKDKDDNEIVLKGVTLEFKNKISIEILNSNNNR